jgi:hypothetical protein
VETRAKLEAALAAAWDRDTLAVYADHLQAEGDPRGELIALDLEIDAHGNTAALSKRRTSLLYAWLGALVPVDNVHASWVGDSLRYGFVENLRFDGSEPNAVARLEQVLASDAGQYIRGMTMTGSVEDLERALGAVARRAHPWLARLAIGIPIDMAPGFGDPARTVAPEIADAAFRAMPRLGALELERFPALGPLSHPTIEKLVVDGVETYAALGDSASFDGVTELDVAFAATQVWDDDYGDDTDDVDAPAPPALPQVAFPSLRRLDLARNRDDVDAAYRFLRTFDARAHVTHLRIAQLRNAADRDDLIAATRDMPALEVVEVARGHYYDPPDLPAVRLVRAETWPWPTQELARGRGLRIYQPGAKYGDTVALLDAVHTMERFYESLHAPARAAWSQLWTAIAALGQSASAFPARVLADAVDACPELMFNGWRELREELAARRPFPPDAVLKIEQCKS